jgi:hypothetical protein
MQFIDTLRRCGIRLGEINLDIRVGNLPSPTLWRDCLSLSQMLDQWSLLQLPLNVMLTLPSLSDGRGMDTEVSQSVWLENAVQMCLAKERVVGVYCTNWNQESDTKLPTALVNPDGHPREPLLRLHHLAREYWS